MMAVEIKTVAFQKEIFNLIERRCESNLKFIQSEIINRDLSRYYQLVFHYQRKIFDTFTNAELHAIMATCHGTIYTFLSNDMLFSDVQQAHLYGKLAFIKGYEIESLLNKIEGLQPMETIALLDITERFWLEVSNSEFRLVTLEELKKPEIQNYIENLRYA